MNKNKNGEFSFPSHDFSALTYSAHAHEFVCVSQSVNVYVCVCVFACMKVEVLAQCMSVYVEGGGYKSTHWCTGMGEKGGCGEGTRGGRYKIKTSSEARMCIWA